MSFEFIDVNAPIDPATRQRIRRQAALGKNLGRVLGPKLSRPAKSRQPARGRRNATRVLNVNHVADGVLLDPVGDESLQETILPSPGHQIGNILSQLRFRTFGPDGLVINAVSFVLQVPSSAEVGIGKAVVAASGKVHMFSQLMFQDEAYFHGAVAISLRALSTRLEAGAVPPALALQHLALSLRHINSRLFSENGNTDADIAVVVVLTQHARVAGQVEDCRVHLEGLHRMVQLRGGINTMRQDLAAKLFRTDISCAHHLGVPALFDTAEIEEFAKETVGNDRFLAPSFRPLTATMVHPELLKVLNPRIRDSFLDAARLTQVLDAAYANKRAWLTVRALHEAILYIGYHLVNVRPRAQAQDESDPDCMIRLSLTSWCLSFWREFDPKTRDSSPLGSALISIIQKPRSINVWTEELVLWSLLTGLATQVLGSDLRSTAMRRVKQCVEYLGLDTWSETTKMLTAFPWSDALNGEAGQMMWDMLALIPSSAITGLATRYDVALR